LLLDPESRASDTYHVEAILMLFVVDKAGKAGKAVFSHTGFQMGTEFILAQQFDYQKRYSPWRKP
jgi:hypothetical protein